LRAISFSDKKNLMTKTSNLTFAQIRKMFPQYSGRQLYDFLRSQNVEYIKKNRRVITTEDKKIILANVGSHTYKELCNLLKNKYKPGTIQLFCYREGIRKQRCLKTKILGDEDLVCRASSTVNPVLSFRKKIGVKSITHYPKG